MVNNGDKSLAKENGAKFTHTKFILRKFGTLH
jgi:hypothetical protein